MNKFLVCSFLSLLTFASLDKGLEIAKRMDAASDGYVGETSSMRLILIDSSGKRIEREMEGSSIELKDMDRTIMNFVKPLDVKGTKLLTWAKHDDDDDQWLFLPSLKRVKRINSKTKGSSFMGSEFSFEDLGGQAIEKYTFDLKKEESFGNEKVWVLERVAKGKSSYSKVVIYVSKKHLTTMKSEYYNQRNELVKIAVFSDFSDYKIGKKTIHRAGKIEMKNVQNNKQSIFLWENRKLGVKLSAGEFTKDSLR